MIEMVYNQRLKFPGDFSLLYSKLLILSTLRSPNKFSSVKIVWYLSLLKQIQANTYWGEIYYSSANLAYNFLL